MKGQHLVNHSKNSTSESIYVTVSEINMDSGLSQLAPVKKNQLRQVAYLAKDWVDKGENKDGKKNVMKQDRAALHS